MESTKEMGVLKQQISVVGGGVVVFVVWAEEEGGREGEAKGRREYIQAMRETVGR